MKLIENILEVFEDLTFYDFYVVMGLLCAILIVCFFKAIIKES